MRALKQQRNAGERKVLEVGKEARRVNVGKELDELQTGDTGC